jgi:hypothetical protein
MHVSSVISAFRHTLQVLHLDVLKLDRVWISVLAFCCLVLVSPSPGADWASAIPSPLLDVDDVQDSAGPRGRNGARNGLQVPKTDVRALASPGGSTVELEHKLSSSRHDVSMHQCIKKEKKNK